MKTINIKVSTINYTGRV